MATFTTNAFNWWLDRILRNTTTRYVDYVSLHAGDPGAVGTANEVAGTGYTRNLISLGRTSGANTNLLSWTNGGDTSWGPITHIGLWNGTSNDYYLGSFTLAIGKTVPAGETLAIGIGDLVISVPSGLTSSGRAALLDAMVYSSSTIFSRYLRLHTGDPGDAGTANFIGTPTGYAAVEVRFGAASGGTSANITGPLFVNNGSVDWPTVTHWSLGTGATGTGYAKGALENPLTLHPGEMARFPAGSLTITLQNN